MTDAGPSSRHEAAPEGAAPARAAARRPGPAGLMLWSLGAFFAVLAVLAVQVRAGGDPALGHAKVALEVAPRRVIVHRIVLRRIVVTDPAPRSSPPARSGSSVPTAPAAPAPAPAASAPSAPAPVPAPAAPAPAAPAPAAPAPAPVTTGTS